MTLYELAKGYFVANKLDVIEKDSTHLVAERPLIANEVERTCVWILTQQERRGRDQRLIEEQYLTRFEGAAKKYPGAKLHLIVDTTEALTPHFRSEATSRYRIRIQVPSQFFDMPFSWESARITATTTRALVSEAKEYDKKRVFQEYVQENEDKAGKDLVKDLLQDIQLSLEKDEPFVRFVVAPAGCGKSVFFVSLFGRLYELFHEQKRRYQLFPRPLPLVADHLKEAAGPTVFGLIDAFVRTEFAANSTRESFNWMIDNRFGLLMLDGLDEVITRDSKFLDYLEDRITAPYSKPAILICVRDSLFYSSEELANFLESYRSLISTFSLKEWGYKAKREHAWVHLENRLPKDGETDTSRVSKYLAAVENNPTLKRLSSTPFYADLLVDTCAEPDADISMKEQELIEHAIAKMCEREYSKGNLNANDFPPKAFREWLEEIAVIEYQSHGISVQELEELAGLAPILVSHNLSEDEQKAIIDNIAMAPFFKRSDATGRLELTHELLSEYLAGKRFANEFKTNPSLFAYHLALRTWPSDSILFHVLSQALAAEQYSLAKFAGAESLSSDGFRNLIQLILNIPGGDKIFRDKLILLEGARLQGLRFNSSNLDGVSFRGSDLTNTYFSECSLRDAHFEGAVFRNTGFQRLPENGLLAASFGNCEHFDSIILDNRRVMNEIRSFRKWLSGQTGVKEISIGPCPTSRQILFLFRKFIHINGQARRDSLDKRGVLRGHQETEAPSNEQCLQEAIEFGYLGKVDRDQIRRSTGPRYGEMVTFVKSQEISPGLRSLLDSLCRIPGCRHI